MLRAKAATCSTYKLKQVTYLQEKADLIFLQQQTNMEHERTDCIVGLEDLHAQCKHLVPDVDHFQLVVTQLCNDNRCIVFETDQGEKVRDLYCILIDFIFQH